jgi:hypothetical protein
MKGLHAAVLVALALLVTACSSVSAQPSAAAPSAPTSRQTIPAGIDPFAPPAGDLMRIDQQGAVIVEVTPVDLSGDAHELEFEVAMNTHSVDLSLDLAGLSTLRTDTGLSVAATQWSGPPGGHHVSGKLTFPANQAGKAILAGVKSLTLSIRDLDAAERVFEWDLK